MTYTFGATVTVSIFTDVEADSEAEALEIAEGRDMQSLCHQCSSGNSKVEWSLSGELDGIANDIKLDEHYA